MSDIELPDLHPRNNVSSSALRSVNESSSVVVPASNGGTLATDSHHSTGNDSGNHSMSTNASREFNMKSKSF